MSNSPRDTQFQGFAKALWQELEDHPYVELGQLKDCDREHLYRVIARRAYGFAEHVARHGCCDHVDYVIRHTPDMTEWPKEQEVGKLNPDYK